MLLGSLVAYSAPVAVAPPCAWLFGGQGFLLRWHALGHLRHLQTSCLVLQAEHNVLMHPFSTCWESRCLGGALFAAMTAHSSSSLVRESNRNRILNQRLQRSARKKRTYTIVAAHGYFGRLIFPVTPPSTTAAALHFCWPLAGGGHLGRGPGRGQLPSSNLNGPQLHHSCWITRPGESTPGRCAQPGWPWASRRMHERTVHNSALIAPAAAPPWP